MIKEIRRLVNPPYTANDLITLFLVLFLLLAVPLTVLGVQNRQSLGLLASSNPCNEDLGDTTKPSVYFADPKNGSHVSGEDFMVRIEAEDNNCVASLTLEIDGKEVKKFRSSPYVYTWDLRTVPVGNHTLSATVSDKSENISVSTINIVRGVKPISAP